MHTMLSYLCALLLALSCSTASAYEFGVAKAKITDGARNPVLQGFADPSQESTGVLDDIYARAFIIKDSSTTVVIVVMDNWSGTDKIKREVIRRINRNDLFEQNFLLTATHSHAAPGGYSDWKLYEQVPGGFDKHNFECIVSGVVTAIQDAFDDVSAGNIYIDEDEVPNAPGAQRSAPAYNANPESERNLYTDSVDTNMLLLKFTRTVGGQEETVAVLNWYAVHPTSLGQDYSKVSGDNKGYAEYKMEQSGIVAAFANSNAGDVSANVANGLPAGKSDSELVSLMQSDGNVQYDAAVSLETSATTALSVGVDYRYTRVDMGNTVIDDQPGEKTWRGGLGLCSASGSKEDRVARVSFADTTFNVFDLREGITVDNISPDEFITEGIIIAGLSLIFGIVPDEPSFVDGHLPKPLILRTGVFNPPLTPNVVPLQIIKVGQLAIVAVPGEPTTMAGRRIKATVQNKLGVSYVAITGYSNEYASYITTREEYDEQHYEGASTLFGRYTLMAFQQEYEKLAQAMVDGTSVAIGASKSTPSVPNMYRVTIRNHCSHSVNVKFYNDGDHLMWVSLDGTHTIPPLTDYAYIVNTIQKKRMRIPWRNVVRDIDDGDMVTISSDCRNGSRGSYIPYHEASF